MKHIAEYRVYIYTYHARAILKLKPNVDSLMNEGFIHTMPIVKDDLHENKISATV